jgi:hypothetical protein
VKIKVPKVVHMCDLISALGGYTSGQAKVL